MSFEAADRRRIPEDVLHEHMDSLAWAARDIWGWSLERLAAALDLVAEVAVDAPACE